MVNKSFLLLLAVYEGSYFSLSFPMVGFCFAARLLCSSCARGHEDSTGKHLQCSRGMTRVSRAASHGDAAEGPRCLLRALGGRVLSAEAALAPLVHRLHLPACRGDHGPSISQPAEGTTVRPSPGLQRGPGSLCLSACRGDHGPSVSRPTEGTTVPPSPGLQRGPGRLRLLACGGYHSAMMMCRPMSPGAMHPPEDTEVKPRPLISGPPRCNLLQACACMAVGSGLVVHW